MESQTDDLAVLQEQRAGRGDESAGGTQFVLVLGQQEVGFGAFVGGAERARNLRRQHQAVVHEGQDAVHIGEEQVAQARGESVGIQPGARVRCQVQAGAGFHQLRLRLV